MTISVTSKASKLKVVLDTNVLISALVFGGRPRMVTDLVAKKVIYPVMSEEIMTEIRRVITEKFPEFTQHGKQLEKLLRHYASWMPLGSINVTVCRDPDDNKFIETALLGKCNYIISGDKDHLYLKTYKTITILSPAQFLDVIDEI